MADPTTVNTSLAVPVRGTDTGTWDTPVNGNFTSIDSMFGGVLTIALSSTPVTLLSSQAINSVIRLTGTLLANVSITLPSLYKFWTIDNQIVNSPSSFCATLVSTSGASIIGLPPSIQDVFYDGTSIRYKNLGQVGEYWDYAAGTVPTWVTASTVPPYLNCDGTSFSSATYPILTNLLGTTTRPDARGRSRYTLNQGSSRTTSSGAGIDGNTIQAAGGNNGVTLTAAQIPTITSVNAAQAITVNTPGSNSVPQTGGNISTGLPGSGTPFAPISTGTWAPLTSMSGNNAISVTSNNTGGSIFANASPAYVGGITMIRAA